MVRQTIKKSEDNFKIAVIRETKQLLIILSYLLSSVILVLPITMNALPCKTSNTVFFFFFLKAIFQVNQVKRYPLAIVTWTRQRGAFSDLDYLRFPLYLQLSISKAWG